MRKSRLFKINKPGAAYWMASAGISSIRVSRFSTALIDLYLFSD